MAGRPLVHAAENMAAEKGGRIAPRLVFRLLGRRSLVHGIGHAYGFPSFLSPAPAVPPTHPWEVIWLQNAFCSISQPWRPAGSWVLKCCSGSMSCRLPILRHCTSPTTYYCRAPHDVIPKKPQTS